MGWTVKQLKELLEKLPEKAQIEGLTSCGSYSEKDRKNETKLNIHINGGIIEENSVYADDFDVHKTIQKDYNKIKQVNIWIDE